MSETQAEGLVRGPLLAPVVTAFPVLVLMDTHNGPIAAAAFVLVIAYALRVIVRFTTKR